MSHSVTAVIVSAGSSSRMQGTDKIFTNLAGVPVIAKTLIAFQNCSLITQIVVVTRPQNIDKITELCNQYQITKLKTVCEGGAMRAGSVLNGLKNSDGEFVAISDGARPLVTPELIEATCEAAFEYGAAAPGVVIADTLKKIDRNNIITTTVDRKNMVYIQTPQVFNKKEYHQKLSTATTLDVEFTDDCSVWEYFGGNVKVVEGDKNNIKITYPQDISFCERLITTMQVKIGHGYDVHRFKEGRELWLCCQKIDYEMGLDGHSDADVAVHALADAILGAAALGDIGKHFPDTDPAYKGMSGTKLLTSVYNLVSNDYLIGNCDITIIAQKPKLAPHIDAMRESVANVLNTDISNVSIKATTEEGLGFTGALQGIRAHAVCTLYKR